VNFAAESHVDRSIFSADDFIRTNVLGTQVLSGLRPRARVKRFCRFQLTKSWAVCPKTSKLFLLKIHHSARTALMPLQRLRLNIWSALLITRLGSTL
jgi:hypothetical protein